MKLESQLVHIGVCTDARTGAISTPLYHSATYRHPALGESTGYDYSRSQNPTRQVLEEGMAALEGGAAAFAFASGMAAVTAVLMIYQAGDHVVVVEDCYGGTYRVLDQVLRKFGLEVTFVDASDTAAVQRAIRGNTRAVLVETPTNPLLKVVDLAALIATLQGTGIHLVVDNTFLTPYFQRPLQLGADIVIHSGTKYLAGHNDLVCGLVVCREAAIAERVKFIQNSTGNVLGPHDSWLLIRSLKTLGLRMRQHEANALAVAQWLKAQPQVEQVYYPGLDGHPGKEIQERQAQGYGGMLSFSVATAAQAATILRQVRLIRFAESLGGVESLITLPAVQTHADVPSAVRERLGITDNLLRLSVGIEAAEDIIGDLAQALQAAVAGGEEA